MRCLLFGLSLSIAACGSGSASRDPQAARPTPAAEVRIVVSGTAESVTARVTNAFLDHDLPVSSTTGNVVEARLGAESGLVGQYDIVARAVVLPSDSGITVRMYGEEASRAMGVAGSGRVGQFSSGRAKRTWESLLAVAASLQPDPSKRFVNGGVQRGSPVP